ICAEIAFRPPCDDSYSGLMDDNLRRDAAASVFVSPQSAAEWVAYYDLRWCVLRAPWKQPRGSEQDDREAESEHIMIAGPDSRPLAIGRLHFNSPEEAQIRFMAVEPEAQGRGLGGRILQELERRARAKEAKSIVLNAREDAQRFYRTHGFVAIGPAPTIFDAVKHVRMRKDLVTR
ncbi:MAG: GNAT family N-acetyltransferase, partial [Spartobacteria bacterium]